MTPEGRLKERVKKLLKTYGIYYVMPIGTSYGRSGVPDFLCCCHGTFFSVETKANNHKATALQCYEMQKIVNAGGIAIILSDDGFGEFIEFVQKLSVQYQYPCIDPVPVSVEGPRKPMYIFQGTVHESSE